MGIGDRIKNSQFTNPWVQSLAPHKLSMVVQASNSSTREVGEGGHPWLHTKCKGSLSCMGSCNLSPSNCTIYVLIQSKNGTCKSPVRLSDSSHWTCPGMRALTTFSSLGNSSMMENFHISRNVFLKCLTQLLHGSGSQQPHASAQL